MKRLNFFDYWLIGELVYCLALLLVLPHKININFWIILTSKQTSGSVLNIFALPVFMSLPNIIQRAVNKSLLYETRLKIVVLIFNIIFLLLTIFWLVTLPFGQ